MTQLKKIDIRRLDGKLLLVFRELLRRRRASEVAEHLGLTQSAISHSLTRLREVFQDELFIRRPHGLEPTRRALELGPKIEHLIDMTRAVLQPSSGFDAASSERRFTLAAPQYVLTTLGGELLATLQAQAPNVSLACREMRLGESISALRSGEIDVALGRFDAPVPNLTRVTLYSDRYCVAARRDHPLIRGRIDLELYQRVGSVFATGAPEGSGHPGLPSASLVATHAIVTQWVTALVLVSATQSIATCPRRLAERYREVLNLQVIEPPEMVRKMSPAFEVAALCPPPHTDPAVDWLVGVIKAAALTLPQTALPGRRKVSRSA